MPRGSQITGMCVVSFRTRNYIIQIPRLGIEKTELHPHLQTATLGQVCTRPAGNLMAPVHPIAAGRGHGTGGRRDPPRPGELGFCERPLHHTRRPRAPVAAGWLSCRRLRCHCRGAGVSAGRERSPALPAEAQFRALETYWYLRLVEQTPHIFELCRKLYPKSRELREALGLTAEPIRDFVEDNGVEALWERIRSDDDFVRDFRLQALRETLTLDYPSYILALAMGAGKTILIGAIIATEFAMAMEYPDANGDGAGFVQNALVFAPGKTIIESLRELQETPYDKLLPPRMFKDFSARLALTFTRDGEKDIPIIRGSRYNVVVTNTEKIRIQKETIRKSDLGAMKLALSNEDEARQEVANLRLQAIASLPHLAIFSDEAHHTYGQSLDKDLKRVRQTVDYLADKTNLICVVNTTGTPYYERQPLRDVVIWYGLSQGIKDGILKDLAGSIKSYDFSGDAAAYVAHVIEDFFRDYGEVTLPNGAPARLAIYFPQTDDLRELKPVIDEALVRAGQSPALSLVNTSDDSLTKPADIDAFNRLNDPQAPHRVILLVNKGTEGWNCPSLFACALARRLKTSNNFVLQAATRCLRQVPGNTHKARVYLSTDNFAVLDRQLQETYGESIEKLNHAGEETRRAKIILRKLGLPPLVVTQERRTVTRQNTAQGALTLTKPPIGPQTAVAHVYALGQSQATHSVLREVDSIELEAVCEALDVYAAAAELGAAYRLPIWELYAELRRVYGGEDVPVNHLLGLAGQIEAQTCHYTVHTEHVDVALALVKPEGFTTEMLDGAETYTAEIVYPKDREHLLLPWDRLTDNPSGFGFHYSPYNFDSNPEQSFFEQMLAELNLRPDEVEDIYFTGALTDPKKTEFFVEYKDDKGKWRRYTPDFIVRKKSRGKRPGKCLIVEVKKEHDRGHPIDGENGRKALAVRGWEKLNPDRLQYEMIFTATDVVSHDQMQPARDFVTDTDEEG